MQIDIKCIEIYCQTAIKKFDLETENIITVTDGSTRIIIQTSYRKYDYIFPEIKI